nr:hypothetical protein K49PH164C2_LOCUS54 [Klebsiella phage vB_Kpl_K49PH164C2]
MAGRWGTPGVKLRIRQRAVLKRLAVSEWRAGEWVYDSKSHTVTALNGLVSRGLAKWNITTGACEITPAGREEARND